jgi:magnesium-transporting ATPase (P-type)
LTNPNPIIIRIEKIRIHGGNIKKAEELNMYDSLGPSQKMKLHDTNVLPCSVISPKGSLSVGQVYLNGKLSMADHFYENDGSMAVLMQILVHCNGKTNGNRREEQPDLESVLLDFAATKGFHKKLFDKIIPKIAEVRNESDPLTAAAIIGLNGQYRLVIKDKPDQLLRRCDKWLIKGRTYPFPLNLAARVQNVYRRMIQENLKVVMLAFKDMERAPKELDPVFQTNQLTLVGMIGLTN